MPHFDFKPAVMSTRFYRYGSGKPEDENITKIELTAESDVFELGFEITLGGLNHLKYPEYYISRIGKKNINLDHDGYMPFYLNFIFYYQRGMRDSVLLNHYSIYVDEEMLKQDSINIMYTITKFRKDIENELEESLPPDFINGIYHLSVSMSYEEISLENKEDFGDIVFDNFQTIFQTKIPYVVSNGGIENG